MAWLRLIALLLLAETAIYLLLRVYIRSLRREALEKLWDGRNPDLAGPGAMRDRFVAAGMAKYETSLRFRLLWLAFILPTFTVMGIIIWVNWQ